MIGGVIGRVLSPIMPYLLGGAVIGGLILSGLLYWKNQQYDRLLSDSASKIERAENNTKLLNQAVVAQEKTISGLLEKQQKEQAQIAARTDQITRLQNSLNEERRQNEKFARQWEKIALARPTLLSRRVNAAIARRVQLLSTLTCRSDCDKDRDKGNSIKTPAETGPDTDN